jgi:hypothetical protein
MWARPATSVLLAVLTLGKCGGADLPAPGPATVAPGRGFAASTTSITISGDGFSVRTIESSSGGAPTLDETFQAWLDDQPLQDVRWVDEQTLSATVPAGLTPGAKALRVQGPFGTSGVLQDAFTVEGSALASMAAAIAATPATVSVGQAIRVTLTVTNAGTDAATTVTPAAPTVAGTGTVGPLAGPDQASIPTLAPGVSGTFTWTCAATGAGTLAFSGAANATDSFSGTQLAATTDPAKPAQVTVQLPTALAASLPSSGAAAIGQEFPVTVTVNNTGGAVAKDVVASTPTVTPAGRATLKPGTGPVPTSAPSLVPGASATFTFTFVAGSVSGTATFSASASGTDANSGAAVTSATTTSGSFTIGAAGMNATLTATPATVSVGPPGSIELTLSVTNPGLADIRNFVVGAPEVTSTDGASGVVATGPTVAPPSILAAGQTFVTAWTFSPSLGTGVPTGHLAFAVALSGIDAFSGEAVPARPSTSVTVQAPAWLTATLAASRTPAVPAGQPFTVNVGQPFTLSLAVTNTGATGAVGVVPAAIAYCSTVSPVSSPIPPGAAPVVFRYSGCAVPTAGTLTLSASASGTDASTPPKAVTTNAASFSVIVETPALVTATGLGASPSTLRAGQPFTVTLTLARTGGAAASVTAAVLTGTTCTTPPAVPVNAVGSGSSLTWSGCTAPATPQTLTLGGSATWVDSNAGTPLTAGPATAAVPVVDAVAVAVAAASIVATPATLSAGQTFSITLTVTKTGGFSANLTAASMDYAGSCALAPKLPVNDIPATQTLVWTGCTAPATPQLLAISGFATWVGASLPLVPHTTSVTSSAVRVLAPAALIVNFAAQPPSSVTIGQVVTLTAHVQNSAPAGGEAATGMAVTPSITSVSGKAAARCTAAAPVSVAIAAGSSVSFGFTCTPTREGSLTFTATANGKAAGSGAALSAAATTTPPTTVRR